MAVDNRITDYDRIADRFDTRYAHYSYDGVRETLVNFLGPQPSRCWKSAAAPVTGSRRAPGRA